MNVFSQKKACSRKSKMFPEWGNAAVIMRHSYLLFIFVAAGSHAKR